MRGVEYAHKLLLAGGVAVIAESYVLFAFQDPFGCIMNGRCQKGKF